MPDGRAREFSFVQECNSVITSPSPEKPLRGKGKYWIEGLAWSGRGKIKKVDVSLDGGISFRPARITSLVLPRARIDQPFGPRYGKQRNATPTP
jgi:sulfane dehydrogenase subunit SoxC